MKLDRNAMLWIGLGTLGIALLAGGTTMVLKSWQNSYNGQKWAPYLANAESINGIPSGLLSRIAYQESHYIQNVIDGTSPSSAGALGLMQLMPQYFDTVNRPIPFSDQDTIDQINQAARQLASLYQQFGDWTAAVAAYNAGAGTINKVIAGTAGMPTETANYIAAIFTDLPQYGSTTLNA